MYRKVDHPAISIGKWLILEGKREEPHPPASRRQAALLLSRRVLALKISNILVFMTKS